MRITVDVNVPSGMSCYYKASGVECDWRVISPNGIDICQLHGDVELDGPDKCYDCLKACVVALEALKEDAQ